MCVELSSSRTECSRFHTSHLPHRIPILCVVLACLQLSSEAESLALQLEDAAELNAALREQAERLVLQQRQKQRRLSVLREQRHGLMEVALAGMQQVTSASAASPCETCSCANVNQAADGPLLVSSLHDFACA